MRMNLKHIAVSSLALLMCMAAATPEDGFVPTTAERERLEMMSRPESWFVANLAGPREVIDGQHIDPRLQYYYEARRRRTPEQVRQSLELFRKPETLAPTRARLARDWAVLTKVTAPMRAVEDRVIDGRGGRIPIRIYTPQTDAPGPLPTLIYFHGGGWLYSSIEAVDRVARLIANEGKVIVVSVDYRLAPDHKWPASGDDGEDAFQWVRGHAAEIGSTPDIVAVGGDSAGGYISLAISRRQVRAGKPGPIAQLLYYTSTGFGPGFRSYGLFGQGYGLDIGFRDFMMPMAFGDAAAVAKADQEVKNGSMAGMPATIVVTAGFDILRDAAQSLARRMEQDRVAVTYLNYPTLTHGFLQFSGVVPDAEAASVDTARLIGTLIRSRAQQLRPDSALK